MRGLKGEQILMRIHIGERDKYHGTPLYEAIFHLLRDRHYAGATIFRGVMGFGASSHIHTDHIELLSLDLPLVIECIETQKRIEAILPDIDQMLNGGLITLERVKVILYRPRHDGDTPPDVRPEEHRIDMTGDWRVDDLSP